MPKFTKKKGEVKKVKGWAVVSGLSLWSAHLHKADADLVKSERIAQGWEVTSCTITFSLPTKKIKK